MTFDSEAYQQGFYDAARGMPLRQPENFDYRKGYEAGKAQSQEDYEDLRRVIRPVARGCR